MPMYDIFREVIFVENIIESSNLNIENLIKEIYNYKERYDVDGRKISNVGGYQSWDFNWDIIVSNNIEYKELNSLFSSIQSSLLSINYGAEASLDISNAWVSINHKHDYNRTHQHPNSIFSGVFYLQNPEDSESIIKFYRSREFSDYLMTQYISHDLDSSYWSEDFKIFPKAGDLLIFPSYMFHEVYPNRSESPRISIAFNTNHTEMDN
jgi:uncharacterized protein (TIGR02466 family)